MTKGTTGSDNSKPGTLEQRLERTREISSPTQAEIDKIYSSGVQQDLTQTIRGIRANQYDIGKLKKWLEGYFSIAKQQREFIKQYGIQAGLFKTSLNRMKERGGIWRILSERAPLEAIRKFGENQFWNSVKDDVNLLPAQFEDMQIILQANYKVVEDVILMLNGVKTESTSASDFYNSEISRIVTDLSENLTKQITLEGQTTDIEASLADQRKICEDLGMKFGLEGYILNEASIPLPGEVQTGQSSRMDELRLDQNVLDETKKYETLYNQLSKIRDDIEALKTEETGYDILVGRAREEYGLNERILKKTIRGLIRQQALLKSEYEAEITYGSPTARILTKTTMAQALGVRAFIALAEYRTIFDEMLRMTVEEGDQIMEALQEFVLSKKWDPEKLTQYEQVLDERVKAWNDFRKERAILSRRIDQIESAEYIEVPEIPSLRG